MNENRPPLLSVDDALARILSGINVQPEEPVSIADAHGRVLAADVSARMTQPPFNASAMDGYAVRAGDVTTVPCSLTVIGESAAGRPYEGSVAPGQAVRIFTGGVVPKGADTVVIQENTKRDGDAVTVHEGADAGTYVRPRGFDFSQGDVLLPRGRKLNARDLSLAASMNVDKLPVRRKPVVAILATGDELVMPGEEPAAGQIISSNPYALSAMIGVAGGEPHRLGIARDTLESLDERIRDARDADILLTIGGASVGEHDLVQQALSSAGMELDFWKIAMRPGKPLMFGHLGKQCVLGLPGNPVSAIVCTRVFLFPVIEKMLGLDGSGTGLTSGLLAAPLEANGPRQHYMRATLEQDANTQVRVRPVRSQDSSLLSPLSQADCLIVRMPGAAAAAAGDEISYLTLDF